MDSAEPRARPSDRGSSQLTKREASQQPNSPSPKRIKKSHQERTSTSQDAEPPAPALPVPFSEKPAFIEERNGEIEIRVVNNDPSNEHLVVLTGMKCLFERQLPEMPKKYIARIVFDRAHLSMAIVKKAREEVIGGITWREFRDRKFAEIVFCAIDANQQVKGYGSFLMAHLKDYIRATSPIMHLLTYGDSLAMGYFQKQGFTKDVTLDKSVWKGYIKDYRGATLMHCAMLPRIRYLEADRMLLTQKETVKAKIAPLSKSDVVHQPPAQWANGAVSPIDPLSIPAIKATGWSPDMDKLAQEPRHGPHFSKLRQLLYDIQNHKQAWPFLAPVNPDEVPGYAKAIKNPMDLSTMEEKLERDKYPMPQDLVNDMKLMFKNCKSFNRSNTVYYKAAVQLEKYMWTLINQIPEWQGLVKKN